MTAHVVRRQILTVICALMVAGVAGRAAAQSEGARGCDPVSSRQLVTGTLSGFRQLASRESIGIAAIGGVAAATAHAVDGDVTQSFGGNSSLNNTFQSGAVLGGTPFELGASFATYAISRAFGKSCVASLGADLFRAQLIAETLTFGVKQATRRSRPEGSGFSFPSGHATAAFASATVLERHFGWKVGVPAYAVATYVAASRVEMRRHYLSDVAFGAALGIAAGRSVTIGSHRLVFTPIASPNGGGGVGLTLLEKKP